MADPWRELEAAAREAERESVLDSPGMDWLRRALAALGSEPPKPVRIPACGEIQELIWQRDAKGWPAYDLADRILKLMEESDG